MHRIVIRVTVELRSDARPNAWPRRRVARCSVGLLQRLEQLSQRAGEARAPLGAEPLEAVTSGPVTSSLTIENPFVGLVAGSVVPTTFQRPHIPIGFRRSRTGHQWSPRSPLRCRITGARPSIDTQPRRHVSPRARAAALNQCQWAQIARARRGVRRGARTGAKTPHWTPPIRAHHRGPGERDLIQSTTQATELDLARESRGVMDAVTSRKHAADPRYDDDRCESCDDDHHPDPDQDPSATTHARPIYRPDPIRTTQDA